MALSLITAYWRTVYIILSACMGNNILSKFHWSCCQNWEFRPTRIVTLFRALRSRIQTNCTEYTIPIDRGQYSGTFPSLIRKYKWLRCPLHLDLLLSSKAPILTKPLNSIASQTCILNSKHISHSRSLSECRNSAEFKQMQKLLNSGLHIEFYTLTHVVKGECTFLEWQ